LPAIPEAWRNPDLIAKIEKLIAVRGQIGATLDQLRKAKQLGNSLEADVTLRVGSSEEAAALENEKHLLKEMLMVAEIQIVHEPGVTSPQAAIIPTTYNKCQRCWRHTPEVGYMPEYPTLCKRCTDVIENL
jgi:isoleucyl-tRNA synthetase